MQEECLELSKQLDFVGPGVALVVLQIVFSGDRGLQDQWDSTTTVLIHDLSEGFETDGALSKRLVTILVLGVLIWEVAREGGQIPIESFKCIPFRNWMPITLSKSSNSLEKAFLEVRSKPEACAWHVSMQTPTRSLSST